MKNEFYQVAYDTACQVYKEARDTIYQVSYRATYDAYTSAFAAACQTYTIFSHAESATIDAAYEGTREAYHHEGGFQVARDAIHEAINDAVRAHKIRTTKEENDG